MLEEGVCLDCLKSPNRGRRWALLAHRCRTDEAFARMTYDRIDTSDGKALFRCMFGDPYARYSARLEVFRSENAIPPPPPSSPVAVLTGGARDEAALRQQAPMAVALVVTTPRMHALDPANLWRHDRDAGQLVNLLDRYGRQELERVGTEELLRRHPEAQYMLLVPHEDVWRPPGEYGYEQGWHESKAARANHEYVAKQELQAFLDERFGRLSRMVRTGAWVLERIRVVIAELTSAP